MKCVLKDGKVEGFGSDAVDVVRTINTKESPPLGFDGSLASVNVKSRAVCEGALRPAPEGTTVFVFGLAKNMQFGKRASVMATI